MSAAAALLLCACSSTDGPSNVIIPPQTLNISRSLQIPAEVAAAAAVVFILVDPLAPNWQVEESPIGPDRVRLLMRKKRFTTGGDGEAMKVFQRRIETIVREQGYAGFEVVEYIEGIDSTMPIAQRVSEGVIQFRRTRARSAE